MKRKDRKGRRGGMRRFSCLCLTMIMLLSAVCADTYASIPYDLPPEAESIEETPAVDGGPGVPAEPGEAEQTGEQEPSGDEISPAETTAPEAADESVQESGREDVPVVTGASDDVEAMVQTQEGLERAIAEGLVTFDRQDSGIAVISTKKKTRAEIVQIAKDQVGIKGRPNKFTYWYGPISGYSNPYAYAWCQVFASWCGCQAGVDVPITASCFYGGEWFKERGLWRSRGSGYKPKAGDYIYFDWSANGGWDHVGIVNYVSDGRVHTIEGNTSDMVKASKSYSLTDTEIIGYGTPKYADGGEQNNLPKGCFDEVLPEKGTNKVRFRGWSFDWDDPSKTVQVHIYVGGKAGSGAPVYAVAADYSRPDVDNAFPGCGQNHGFDVTIDVPVDRTKDQKVYAYAIDAGGLDNPLLGNKTLKADTTITEEKKEEQPDGTPGISEGIQQPEASPSATPTPSPSPSPSPSPTPTPSPTPVTVGKTSKPTLKQAAYNQFQLTWDAVKEATGYEVEYAPDKSFKNPQMYAVSKTSATIKVACGSTRYFRVRAIRTVDKVKYYGDYSSAVSGKTMIGKTKLTSCTSKKKKRITISTTKVEGATSYQVAVSLKKNFAGAKYAATKSGSGSMAVNRSNKYYYVKTRARRKVNGKYVYGPYSEAKKVKVK